MAVQVAGGLAASGLLQDLGEARRRIEHIVGGDAVHGLGHAVARAVACPELCGERVEPPVEGLPLLSPVHPIPFTLAGALFPTWRSMASRVRVKTARDQA